MTPLLSPYNLFSWRISSPESRMFSERRGPSPLSQILLSIKDRQNKSNCSRPDPPKNSGRSLVKQDCASTLGNKGQYPRDEFKAKRTGYARVSSSYSNEL